LNLLKKINALHVVIFALIIFIFLLFEFKYSEIFNLTGLVQSFIIGVFTLIVLLEEIKKEKGFSPLFFISLLFFLHYALPGIFYNIFNLYYDYQNSLYAEDALIYISFLYISVVLFSYLVFPSTKKKRKKDTYAFDEKKLLRTVIIFEVIGAICKFLIISNNLYFQVTRASRGGLDGPFYSLIIFFETLPIYAMLVSFIYYLKTGSRRWKTIFIITFILELVYWLPTGRKEEVINLIIFPIIILYFIRGTFPKIKIIIPAIVFLFVLFPVTKMLRDAIGISIVSNQSLTLSEIGDIIGQNINVAWADQNGNISTTDNSENFASIKRLGIVEETAAVIKLTKEQGYLYGSTYARFLYSFIPRIIWPDKPELTYGKEFGRMIGVVGSDDDITSASISIPAEAYWNFQYFGFIILFIIFSFAHVLYSYIYQSRYQSSAILLYIVFLKTFLYLGSDFVSAYTGVVKFLLIFTVIVKYLKSPTPIR